MAKVALAHVIKLIKQNLPISRRFESLQFDTKSSVMFKRQFEASFLEKVVFVKPRKSYQKVVRFFQSLYQND